MSFFINMEINLQWTKEEIQIFSKTQIDICNMWANGYALERIMLKYNVSRQAIYSAICATLKGNRWFSHSEKGGGDGYLGDVEIDKFKTRISEA